MLIAIIQTISKLESVVSLDALDGIGKLLGNILNKLCRRIGAVLLLSFENTKTTIFINEGILKVTLTLGFPNQTGFWNKLHIDLSSLTGILHLLIRF